jgi:hypothetical protein
MEEAKNKIIESTARAIADFWPEFVAESVKASGEKLSELPIAEVSRIKAEVAAITENPQSASRTALERPDWPHEKPTEDLAEHEASSNSSLRPYQWLPERSRRPDRGPSALDEAVRIAAAAPALPFRSAGLKTPRAGASSGKPVVAWDFKWTEEMLGASASYGEFVKELQGLMGDLRNAHTSRDRNDAQDLWDHA